MTLSIKLLLNNWDPFNTNRDVEIQVFTIPGTASTVEIVFIDTIILVGLTHPIFRTIPPSGPKSVSDAEQQWEWIEDTLKSSNADWLIVCGHYPGTIIWYKSTNIGYHIEWNEECNKIVSGSKALEGFVC